jgi:branched-chain amino acid transport system ATP-binding protein
MLKIENLTAWYGNLAALKDISLSLAPGERAALLGHNGAGKTTLLRCVVGGLRRVDGTIDVAGKPVAPDAVARNVAQGIGFVPQGHNVFPNLSVEKNLSLAGLGHDAGLLKRVYTLFPILDERRRQRAGSLSGGQQQMLAIGMALTRRPKLLLLDEPTTGLAPVIVKSVFASLREIAGSMGTTLLVVEQNVQAALDFAERAVVLKGGRVAYDGPSTKLRAESNLWELF